MAEASKIEWTENTFNPWWGCAKVSPGCDNCYAERDAHRFEPARALWGVDAGRREFSDKHWDAPRRWNAKAEKEGKRIMVFCASMADVFDKNAPDGARDRLWQLIKETPFLTWQILTKRIGNAKSMLPADWGSGYPNVWLGISIVNQEEADRDIAKLLGTPAAVRWLSMEPLLGPVTFRWAKWVDYDAMQAKYGSANHLDGLRGIDWVIVGGESGPQARPMHPDWSRDLRNQCAEAGVPFLFKQWGEWLPTSMATLDQLDALEDCRIGHTWEGGYTSWRVGKKVAGRLLNGRLHDGYPSHDQA